MTMTTHTQLEPRRCTLERRTAMRLAAAEYARVVDQLRSLTPAQWAAPTECPGWDVRAMAGHMLGMADMAASIRESSRQIKTAASRGGVLLDALTGLQVEEHAHLSTAEVTDGFATVSGKAAKARKRTPFFIRRKTMPHLEHVNGVDEPWTVGYLVDTILTRDPWMHRADIARATGVDLVLTSDHDGVIVDDVVHEWAGRHGQPCTVHLSGAAGGSWTFGPGGPSLEFDAIAFCRTISGRGPADGLLTTGVPF